MPNGEAERANEEMIKDKTGGGTCSPRVSPVGPAPLPPKKAEKVEKMYAVFAEADIKSSWPTLEEARDIAEDAAQRFNQPMLIFQLVGKEHKR